MVPSMSKPPTFSCSDVTRSSIFTLTVFSHAVACMLVNIILLLPRVVCTGIHKPNNTYQTHIIASRVYILLLKPKDENV